MTDVFISYSRKDSDLMRQLHSSLSAINRDVWVDWEDIPATADWLTEIYTNIENTNTFLFMVSPHSITSLVCNLEIDHAVKFNKRLVPIIFQDVDFDEIIKQVTPQDSTESTRVVLGEHDIKALMRQNWKALSRHNWLFFRTPDELKENFPKLITAIDTDFDHVADHTRWLVRALDWDNKGRNASFLLSGAQLREAEAWLTSSAGKDPIPLELHQTYISASRRRENQRQRTLFAGVVTALIVAIALAVYALIQSNAAQNSLSTAEARGTEVANQVVIAANNAGTAAANANTATVAQGQAQDQADKAATQAAIAQNAATAVSNAQATSLINERNAIDNAATATFAQGQAQDQADNAATQAAIAQIAATAVSNAQATSLVNERNAIDNAATATIAQGQALDQADNAATQAAIAQIAATAVSNAQATSLINERNAIDNAATATFAQGQAQDQANNAATQAAIALENAATATFAQGQAQDQANNAATQAAIALENAATATIAQGQAQNEALRAQAAQSVAEQRANEAQSLLLTVSIERLLSLGDPDLALSLALEAAKTDPNSWVAQNRLLNVAFAPGTRLVFDPGHTGAITHLTYSPNGKYVASSSLDGSIILWDAQTGKQIQSFTGHTEGVNSVAFSPDSQLLISASDDNSLILWNFDGQPIRTFRNINNLGQNLNRDATAAVFRQDGQTIISGWGDGQIIVFERDGRDRLHLVDVTNSPITDLDLSPDRQGQFVLVTSSTSIEVWNMQTATQRNIFLGKGGAGAYSPDGQYVLISAASGQAFNPNGEDLILREISSGLEKGRYRGHTAPITDVVFLPDGTEALSASEDGTIILWDIAGQKELRRYYGHGAPVTHITVSPDGHYFVSADNKMQIRLWEIEPEGIIRHYSPAAYNLIGLQYSRDGQTILASYDDHSLGFWNVANGTEGNRRFYQSDVITSFAYSPDESQVVSADASGTVSLWSTRTYDRKFDLSAPGGRAVAAYAPDGSMIATGNTLGWLRLWNPQNGQVGVRHEPDAGAINEILYFDQGSRLLTVHPDALVIRNSQTGDIIRKIESSWTISQAIFSPDERWLLTATDNNVILWDMTNPNGAPMVFGGDGEPHTASITGLAFSPDGGAALSSSEDGTIRLWDVASGRLLYVYQDSSRIPRGVVFNPDGQTFAASDDNEIGIFKSGTKAVLTDWIYANRYVIRLTCADRDRYGITPSCTDGGIVPTLTPTGTLLPTYTPTITQTPSATPLPTEAPLPVGRIVSDGKVNVRDGNSGSAKLLGQLENGDLVFILGNPDATPGWVHIRTQDGLEGWVIRKPVDLLGSTQFLPTTVPGGRTATPTPTPTAPPEVTLRSDNNGNINIRSGPGEGYPTVSRVPSGTTAVVLVEDPGVLWTKIRLVNGTEGWVYRPVVRH